MEQPRITHAAEIIAVDAVYENGDFERPSDMLARFKQWQQGVVRANNEYAYPEFTGVYEAYLVQMWRDTSRQNAHYVARGDLRHGVIESAAMSEVVEMSRHKDLSDLSLEERQDCLYYLESQPLRDFPDLRGRVRLGGVACAVYASVDRIHLLDEECQPKRIRDILQLENDIYRLRHSAK